MLFKYNLNEKYLCRIKSVHYILSNHSGINFKMLNVSNNIVLNLTLFFFYHYSLLVII